MLTNTRHHLVTLIVTRDERLVTLRIYSTKRLGAL